LRLGTADENACICGNKGLLYASLTNVLQNAFEFTQRSTQVIFDTFVLEGSTLIEVADDCGGIPENELNAIFARLSKARLIAQG